MIRVVSFRKTILIPTIGTHKEIMNLVLKDTFCMISIVDIQMSIMFSATVFLKPGFHPGISLVVSENQKLIVPQTFSSDQSIIAKQVSFDWF